MMACAIVAAGLTLTAEPVMAETELQEVTQQQGITGTVVDAQGEPIIGATVRVKGTKTATVTDLDGHFTLNIRAGQQLEISYVGMNTIETVARQGMTVKLEDNSKALNEVVVVGYGTMRKKDLTGSIVQIRPDKIADENPGTIQDILRGTPGLSVGYNASAKGGGSMQIRGQRSVYTSGGHNDPLIILDGMAFYGELSEINPDDVGQIDVLKDASAAAIYGAKAANGVIIITTKKGKIGKPTINVTANFAANQKSDYFSDVFSPSEYMKYREDWYKRNTYGLDDKGNYVAYAAKDKKGNLVATPGYFDTMENAMKQYGLTKEQWLGTSTADALTTYGERLDLEDAVLNNFVAGKTFDWWDHTFRTGFNQDYNASISGASENMNYYLSAGWLRNQGAVVGDDYRATRVNMKLNGKVNKWLEVGMNVNFQDRSDGNIQVGLGTNYWDANQLRNSPYADYRYEDGTLAQYPQGANVQRGYNFDYEKQFIKLSKGYQVLNTIFNAKVSLPFGITYSFNASPRYQYYQNKYFTSYAEPNTNPKSRGVDRGWGKRFDWSLNNTITWDYTLAKLHHFVLTLVQEAEERRYWSDYINARNILPSDALGYHNTQNATKEDSSFGTSDSHQTADALLARLFYSYDNRYMLTLSVRRDGYSAFGSSNPYATFPSVATAWSFTNEKFWKWGNIMSTGKLRLSWGKNGNRSLSDPYISLANLGSGTGATMGYITKNGTTLDMKYLSVDRLANPSLEWEKTSSTNLGLDFGFLNDRITGSFDLYFMQTKDMIMSQRLPGFSGFGSITTNLGQVDNNGFEIAINSVNMKTKDFEWTTGFALSYNHNEIKHLYYEYEDVKDKDGNVIGRKEMDDKSNGWFIGKPIGEIWGYKQIGIWQADEYEEAAKYGQRPGDPKVWNNPDNDEYNADGTVKKIVYNDDDKVFLGQKSPMVHWSLRNDFTYKNFNFSFNIYSYMGHKSTETYYLNGDNGGSMITYGFNTWKKDYWTPEHPSNTYARLDAKGPVGAEGAGRLHNRDFIRLENITLGYTFPRKWLGNTGIERLKLYGTIRNVCNWACDWEYGDPETSGLATRMFTFGINVTL